MIDEEVIATEEDLKGLLGRGVFLYRFRKKQPYVGKIGSDKAGLPAIVLGDKVVSLRALDILDFGCVEVTYISKKGV